MAKRFLIVLSAFLVITSCQDNKTKRTKVEKSEKTEKKETPETPSQSVLTTPDRAQQALDTITKVGQRQLIPFLTEYGKKNPETIIRITTEFGDIDVELYQDTPLHRANFIRLAKMGYYNTTYFYRVDKGFVIQAGNSDRGLTGKMRSAIGDFLIPKEFKKKYRHSYGAFAAAKYSKQNVSQASSPYEFYIVMDKQGAPHLDDDHTVYGRVIEGMDVAEKIADVKTGASEWPVDDVEIEVNVLR